MKKAVSFVLAALLLALCACGGSGGTESAAAPSPANTETAGSATAPATDASVTAVETTDAFSLTTEDGAYTQSGSVYTITAAGTYVVSGLLSGQILVDAGADDEVVLALTGATITYGEDSPIRIVSAGSVDISAKSGTDNVINDTRGAKPSDESSQGEGAIDANCDLKLKGTGTLVVNAGYSSGVSTTKDLTIQKLSLKSVATNNALKGGDSVTVTGGTVVAISTNGDGVRTEHTDTNKHGETRGDITISGGAVTVYAAGDGFQAAHDFVLAAGEDGSAPTVVICTGSYSSYTASGAATSSYKGVKVQNELNILAGSITIESYDDGLHADSGASLDDGTRGQGNVNISGGSVTMNVYAPENKTAGGRMGPGGWSGQQTVAGADGIHADHALNISGGTVMIDSAYEGLEANIINISGGSTCVSANDDGVNACKGSAAPQVNVSGGYLDVTVSPDSDTDGIDSNGTYTQTGGVVITRGPNNRNMAALDTDGTASITGGTLILLGYGAVSAGSGVKSYSLSLHSAGSHTVKIGGVSYTFTNAGAYGSTACYSDATVSA